MGQQVEALSLFCLPEVFVLVAMLEGHVFGPLLTTSWDNKLKTTS